jgi:hypothetical protein
LPLPDPPDVIVTQLEFSVALHAHSAPAVTWIVPVDVSEPTLVLVGEMLNTQATGAGFGAGAGGAGEGAGVGESGAGAGSGVSVGAAC